MNHPTVVPAIRRTSSALASIVIRIIVARRVVKTINTGLRINPANWDADARRVSRREPSAALYNSKIRAEVARLEVAFAQQEVLGVSITGARARRIAEGGTPSADFYAFARDWIVKKYTKPESRRTMISEVGKMERFRPDLAFGDIGFEFLTAYRSYMADTLGNSSNTIWKSLRCLNTLLNDAARVGGIIESNPIAGMDRGRYRNPEKFGVDLADCDRLEALIDRDDIPPQVRFAATRFLLMAYAGLRFADAIAFDPAVHVHGDRLIMRTQKKGVLLDLKIHRRLGSIIPRLGPTRRITNQELNRWLKVAASMAGITARLTCHVGRHTFGALLADLDIPIEVAQRLMAHADARSTRVYFHIKKTALDRAVDKLDKL